MRQLATAARGQERPTLPTKRDLPSILTSLPAEDAVVLDEKSSTPVQAASVSKPHTRARTRCHASIGPSCAVAHFENDVLTVWSHTQGVYPDRAAIAEMLKLPQEKFAASTWKAPAATVTTAQMMPRPMPRCSHAPSRAAGPRAMDARAGARVGAVRPGHGDEGARIPRCRRTHRRGGTTSSGATRTRRARAGRPAARRRSTSRSRSRRRRRRPNRAGGQRRPQRHSALRDSRTSTSSGISCATCRCACRRCAHSAPT